MKIIIYIGLGIAFTSLISMIMMIFYAGGKTYIIDSTIGKIATMTLVISMGVVLLIISCIALYFAYAVIFRGESLDSIWE